MNQFLFKKLDIEPTLAAEIKDELNKYVFNRLTISEENAFSRIDHILLLHYCPKLKAYLTSLGLTTMIAGLIRSFPKQVAGQPHIDSFPQVLAINFPVCDCENSSTNFYEPYNEDGSPPILTTLTHPNGVEYYHYKDAKWNLLGSVTLDSPTLLNIKVPHKVDHRGDLTRVSISLRFKEDPWHLTSE